MRPSLKPTRLPVCVLKNLPAVADPPRDGRGPRGSAEGWSYHTWLEVPRRDPGGVVLVEVDNEDVCVLAEIARAMGVHGLEDAIGAVVRDFRDQFPTP